MAFYQNLHLARNLESILLINPSIDLWQDFTSSFRDHTSPPSSYNNWMTTTLIVIRSLTANWPAYITALHKAVEEVKNDASFTDPKIKRIDEADTQSMELCVDLMDRLQQSVHVLTSNIDTLEAVLREARRRQMCKEAKGSEREWVVFESGVEDVVRELRFASGQIELIVGRLERVTATVSDCFGGA
jgi:hypothetical protein